MTDHPSDTPDPNEAVLRNLDYSHSWTFDVEHVVEIYQVCRSHPGETALEIGSFRGHCALALSLAGLEVTSIDISDEHLALRQALAREHGQRITFLIESSDDHLLKSATYDVILHDNGRRGSALYDELDAYWHRQLAPGGLLIVHNVEQIDMPRLLEQLAPESQFVTADRRGRQVGYFVKSG